MNRNTLFPSLGLILPICKHVEVLIYFPSPTHLGCFTSITLKKIISNRKIIVQKKSDTVLRKKSFVRQLW